ncbi:hypothetical protein EVAR_96849_1 [Eumeta japonica]|uniref:Uncharacterized protein n=1 Tax=Eumeta variegata TaxID=151549 RepID=A0A4C1WMR5_EUMVA|nr:hypothetical protein EVAR_96849_1 [Eumeta japonica]
MELSGRGPFRINCKVVCQSQPVDYVSRNQTTFTGSPQRRPCLQGTIFCVDSAPDVFPVQLKAVLEDVSENDIQNAVIDHMYTVIAGKESEGLSEQLVSISSWKDKIDLYSQHLRGTTHCSSQYVRTLIDTAYGRIVEAKKYDPDHLKKSPMRSKIVLMRCRTQPEALAACPSDFGLSQYTRQPVDVHELQAEHSDALLDLRCTPIVHKYLDPRLLEDYSQKNLCETYSPFNNTFLNVADYTSED